MYSAMAKAKIIDFGFVVDDEPTRMYTQVIYFLFSFFITLRLLLKNFICFAADKD